MTIDYHTMNVKTSFFGSRLYIDVRLSCLFRILNLTSESPSISHPTRFAQFDYESLVSGRLVERLYDIADCRLQFVAIIDLAASVRRHLRDAEEEEVANVALQRLRRICRQAIADDCCDILENEFAEHWRLWSDEV